MLQDVYIIFQRIFDNFEMQKTYQILTEGTVLP